MAVEYSPFASVLYPNAAEYCPIFAGIHVVPVTAPARNALSEGTHSKNVPAALVGVAPVVPLNKTLPLGTSIAILSGPPLTDVPPLAETVKPVAVDEPDTAVEVICAPAVEPLTLPLYATLNNQSEPVADESCTDAVGKSYSTPVVELSTFVHVGVAPLPALVSTCPGDPTVPFSEIGAVKPRRESPPFAGNKTPAVKPELV